MVRSCDGAWATLDYIVQLGILDEVLLIIKLAGDDGVELVERDQVIEQNDFLLEWLAEVFCFRAELGDFLLHQVIDLAHHLADLDHGCVVKLDRVLGGVFIADGAKPPLVA